MVDELIAALKAVQSQAEENDQALLKLCTATIERLLALEERHTLLLETVQIQAKSLALARECIEMLIKSVDNNEEISH